MNAVKALKQAMREQGYDPKYAGGVIKMLEMNGFEIVSTKDLDTMIRTYTHGFGKVSEVITKIERVSIERTGGE